MDIYTSNQNLKPILPDLLFDNLFSSLLLLKYCLHDIKQQLITLMPPFHRAGSIPYISTTSKFHSSNRIDSVMVSVFASSAVDGGFEPWSGQTKDCKIGICCFSAKHAALTSKSKDWLAWNQNNVLLVE